MSLRKPHRSALGLITVALCALYGCTAQPQPTVEGLRFPVLVLFEASGVVRHDDAADLRNMGVQRVAGSNSPPFLVDSNLDIYRLDRLASVHGGLWLMANPSGRTDVTFDLVRVAEADPAQARELIAARDARVRSGADAGMRQRLEQAQTLDAMLTAIER